MDNDCWLTVFTYLPLNQITNCSLTCKQFNEILNGNNYWQPLIRKDYDYQLMDTNYKNKYTQYHELDKLFKKIRCDLKIAMSSKTLNIAENNIKTIPNEINLLLHLETLILNHNWFLTFPKEICQLTNLKFIDMGFNGFTTIPPEIKYLTKLEKFNAFCTHLEKLPNEFGDLTNLQYLCLYGSKIKILPQTIQHLTKLQHMDLGYNALVTLPTEIGHLTNLTYLSIKMNNTLESLPRELNKLIKLDRFMIDSSQEKYIPINMPCPHTICTF